MKLPKLFKLPRLFKSHDPNYAVIDIGTSEVTVGVCREGDDLNSRTVLGVGVQPQGRTSVYSGKILDLDAVIETINLAFDEAVMKASVAPKRAILGLSGGVVVPRSYRVRVRREAPEEKMGEKEFEVLAGQIESTTMDRAQSELSGATGEEFVRVETVFVSYQMDGARVTTPLDIPGAEIEVTVLHYFMESSKVRSVNSLADQLNLEIVSLVDTAVYAATRWSEAHGDFVLLDIGGDTTQLVVIDNGKIAEDQSLFIGGRDITHAIESELSVGYEQAEQIKINYASGHLDQERARVVHGIVSEVVGYIVDAVVIASRSTKLKQFPPKFLISGGTRHLEEVTTALNSHPWAKENVFGVFPKIETLPDQESGFNELTKMEL
ncbi:pilus assembly protein PilM [candidate division WWE3 bacterium]|uniref:Pilus assembly protein PilM n=1 Tax=candidate division WWE3 bacterium TaxID=2053526 RepID=A0A955LK41_UNCKA|nr:pilus assembly protein PilM [candidate division WWE3 bacterium]